MIEMILRLICMVIGHIYRNSAGARFSHSTPDTGPCERCGCIG